MATSLHQNHSLELVHFLAPFGAQKLASGQPLAQEAHGGNALPGHAARSECSSHICKQSPKLALTNKTQTQPQPHDTHPSQRTPSSSSPCSLRTLHFFPLPTTPNAATAA